MEYRPLQMEELVPALLASFQRHQVITHCWQKSNGQWRIQPAPRIIENWGDAQREFLCDCLRGILSEGGMVSGAFSGGVLKGFIAVEGTPMGSRNQYLAVSLLHVSQECRGCGIGRRLFAIAKAYAAEKGVQKLYLSTQASLETQAFYMAVGCTEAGELIPALAEQNPHECQLECGVN